MNTGNKDAVYASPRTQVTRFEFDKAVADVFPDMIRRSVPGYADVLAMTSVITGRYVQQGTHCYDLGCSLGATTQALARGIESVEGMRSKIIAIDNAPAMIEQCRQYLDKAGLSAPVELHCADIRNVDITNASVVVLNYTLQFIPPDERLALLKKINDGLNPGGVLVLSEKLSFSNPEEQERLTALHLDFKRAHGYSELEISQKRTALENVLIPDTFATHKNRLTEAGFSFVSLWFQSLNFASLLAVKHPL